MGRSGKTFTVFLIVFFLMLLALTSIVTFFFVKEREIRETTEKKLAVSEEARLKIEDQYKAAQEEITVLTNKMKEQDEKISGLMDDIELEKGLKEEIKKENTNLKGLVESIGTERKKFQDEVISLRERNTFLESEMNAAKELRDQLSTKLQEAESKLKELEEKLAAPTNVNLETIVVTPEGTPEEAIAPDAEPQGQILKINEENNFAIIDLGTASGITEGMIVEFYRGETLLGEGKIARVQNIMSVADFVEPLTAKKVQLNDRVTFKK
jgi:hypothetical protein